MSQRPPSHSTMSALLERWSLTGLKVQLGFLAAEFRPNDQDRDAAWELYAELLTRITTQALPDDAGDEATALDSVYKLFEITRGILRAPGRRQASEFTKLAVVVLNQVVRPFTARWHKARLAGAFADPDQCDQFRQELAVLQTQLIHYTGLLSEVAAVEDLSQLENPVPTKDV